MSDHRGRPLHYSHRYQGRALPNPRCQAGGVGLLHAKFGNRIQYATSVVWGVCVGDSRVRVHLNPVISRELRASISALGEEAAMDRAMHTSTVNEVRFSPMQSTQLHKTRIRSMDGSFKVRADSTFMSASKFACDMLRFRPQIWTSRSR